jgi:iron complex outermembrane receptor protein
MPQREGVIMKAMKRLSLCSVSLGALLLWSPANAQTAAPQSNNDQDVIVVSGIRASIIGSLNVRKNSTQIVDSIVAEDVGKLPDNNVIEALQRVTGVQVTNRAGGEAAGISIRGLPDALTTLNGRKIFTADGQSFALQDLSANLIKQVSVYKTRSADQLETGLAGQIDVQTRHPFDFKDFAFSAQLRGIYNQQADSYNPNFSALISKRWDTSVGEVGVLVNGSYSRTKYRDMTTTAGAFVPFATENPPAASGFTPLQRIFSGWQPGLDYGLPTAPGSTLAINGVNVPYYLSRDAVFSSDFYGKRERPAVNVALQWAPNTRSTYTAEFFYNGYRGQTFNSLLFSFVDWWGDLGASPATSFKLYPGTNIIKSRYAGSVYGFNSADFTASRTDSYLYGLNGKWDVGQRGKVEADLSYQDSQYSSEFFAMRTDRVSSGINVDFNAGGGIPAFSFTDQAKLTDASAWNIAQLYDNGNKSRGSALTASLKGQNEWDEGLLRKVEAGVRVDSRKAASDVRSQGTNSLGQSLSTLGAGALFTNSGFYDGRAAVPTSWVVPSGWWLYDHQNQIRNLYHATFSDFKTTDQLKYTNVFNIQEKTVSAYLQGDGEVELFHRPLRFQAGLRFVYVDTDFNFTDQYSAAHSSASTNSRAAMPSFTARYDLTRKLRLRFNYGETMRRPNFADLNPNYSLTGDLTSVGYGSGSSGNPNLKPTKSKNYDAAVEWYFASDSALYTTLFRRDVQGLVVSLANRVSVGGTGLNTSSFVVTQPQNASNGVLKGAEVGFTLFPHRLPRLLKGFGLLGSFTLLDSTQNIPLTDSAGNVVGQTSSAFFGVSDYSFNVTAAYERGPVGARLSYVWRSAFLANNEARLFANPIGVWRTPEKSLDMQLTYNINKRLGVTFDAVNLTNATQQTYYKFGSTGNAQQYNLGTTLLSRTFAMGVRYAFQ